MSGEIPEQEKVAKRSRLVAGLVLVAAVVLAALLVMVFGDVINDVAG